MFWVCLAAGAWTSRVLPDGRSATPNPVAYLDASHLEGASSDPWRSDGLAGLKLTLMRNGYLPLSLYELTPERLQRAGLLISIAPARGFSWTERPAVDYFVNKGGIFICTVGADQAQAVNPLLEQFELRVRAAPAPPEEKLGEPMSLGFFRSAHLDAKGNRVDVLFYAGWPVDCSAEPWEQDLLESLLWRPKLVAAARKQVVPVQFVFDPYRRIYAAACRLDEAGTLPTPERLQAEFTEQPMRDLIGELYRGGLARGISDRQMEDISEAIEASRLVSSDVLVRRFDEEPLVVVRYLGQGKAALVADGGFALNKNLEMADGEPIDGGRENALFWRWFLTYLNGQPQWFPPKPPSAPAPQSPAGEVQP